MVNWLLFTDAGLGVRIGCGVLIFFILAMWDLKKKGASATRWKEYVFLFVGAIAGGLFGAVHDLVTSRISWEFFAYFKGLAHDFSQLPPGAGELAIEAVWLGAKASWSVGLIASVAVLIANNPGKKPQLGYRRLYKLFIIPITAAAVGSAIIGTLGYFGALNEITPNVLGEIQNIRHANVTSVWCCNLGAYIGGLIGAIWAVTTIVKSRKRFATIAVDN